MDSTLNLLKSFLDGRDVSQFWFAQKYVQYLRTTEIYVAEGHPSSQRSQISWQINSSLSEVELFSSRKKNNTK